VEPDAVPWPAGIADDRFGSDDLRTVSVPDGPWTLIHGGSSVYFGFDRTQLPFPSRKQTFERGFPSDVALALAWTLRTAEPPPSRIVWGVNVAAFVDRPGDLGDPCLTTVARSRPDPSVLTCPSGWPDPWLDRRATTRDAAATWLRWALGWGPPAPPADPWFGYDRPDPAILARNVAAWERLGVFGPDALHEPHVAAASHVPRLAGTVPLTVVVMPEHSEARRRYVPGARARFDAFARTLSADVLDLWEALPDTGFHDQGHPNTAGRARASARLAEHLGR
jgi:hypothetical protein